MPMLGTKWTGPRLNAVVRCGAKWTRPVKKLVRNVSVTWVPVLSKNGSARDIRPADASKEYQTGRFAKMLWSRLGRVSFGSLWIATASAGPRLILAAGFVT